MPVIKIDISKFNKREMTHKQTTINGKRKSEKKRNTQRQEHETKTRTENKCNKQK